MIREIPLLGRSPRGCCLASRGAEDRTRWVRCVLAACRLSATGVVGRLRGAVLSAMPARITRAAEQLHGPNGSPKASAPAAVPTSGSRFRNAPASSGAHARLPVGEQRERQQRAGEDERDQRHAPASSVAGAAGMPSSAAFGQRGQRAARSSAPRSRRSGPARAAAAAGATTNVALSVTEASTSASPPSGARRRRRRRRSPRPRARARSRPTRAGRSSPGPSPPRSARRAPAPRRRSAPRGSTLVRWMPGVLQHDHEAVADRAREQDPRRERGAQVAARDDASSGAASAKRTTVSQPPAATRATSLDSGTVSPHRSPAAMSATMAE